MPAVPNRATILLFLCIFFLFAVYSDAIFRSFNELLFNILIILCVIIIISFMISSIFSSVKNILVSSDNVNNQRKRRYMDIDDDNSDDDEIIVDAPISPKRAKSNRENKETVNDENSNKRWFSPITTAANWVLKRSNTFRETYYYSTIPSMSELLTSEAASPLHAVAVVEQEMTGSNSKYEVSKPHVRAPLGRSNFSTSSNVKEMPRRRKSQNGLTARNVDTKSNGIQTSSHTEFVRPLRKESTSVARQQQHQSLTTKNFLPVHEKLFNGTRNHSRLVGNESRAYRLRSGTNLSTPHDSVRLKERDEFMNLLIHQYSKTNISASTLSSPTEIKRPLSTSIGPIGSKSFVRLEKLPAAFSKEFRDRTEPVVQIRNRVEEVHWSLESNNDVEIVEIKEGPSGSSFSSAAKLKMPTVVPSRISMSRSESQELVKTDKDCEIVKVTSPVVKRGHRKEKKTIADEATRKKIVSVETNLKKAEERSELRLRTNLEESRRLEEIHIVDDDEEEEEEVEPLPVITDKMMERIVDALRPTPPNQVLSEGFNLSIMRRDIETLDKMNWLNDEVINFYFSLLMERGKLDNFPSVYAMNTFFYPKLLSGGHSVLKRWTRKVDIFANDFLLIPVHLDIHWCLAVVDFGKKKVSYYDSMGGSNNACLEAILKYLEAELKDKKKQNLDLSEWTTENVKDVPRQLNGSDCGMFACKYAEYISRRAKITFTQDNMPYFRKRMVYEILTKQLL